MLINNTRNDIHHDKNCKCKYPISHKVIFHAKYICYLTKYFLNLRKWSIFTYKKDKYSNTAYVKRQIPYTCRKIVLLFPKVLLRR